MLIASAVFEAAVAVGIVLESPKEKTLREKLGLAFVFGGVFLGWMVMYALFIFDEGISTAQQSKIIALETELTPRRITNVAEFADKLRSYAGTPFFFSVAPSEESFELEKTLTVALTASGWKEVSFPGTSITLGGASVMFGVPGISLEVSHKKPQWFPAMGALAKALTTEGLKPEIVQIATDDVTPDVGVHVVIGVKPLASFINGSATSPATTTNSSGRE